MNVTGTCRHCMRRRHVYSVQRYGGGNYRRPPRWYRSSICTECAAELLKYSNSGMAGGRFDAWSLQRVVERAD